MLAYVFRHWPLQGLDRGDYEATLLQFHRSIANESPAGFHRSFVFRLEKAPWIAATGSIYEDWYLVENFCCLGITQRRCGFREKSLSSRQYCTASKWRKRRTLPASSWGAALREGARGSLVFEATRLAISRILCRRSPRSFGQGWRTLGASDGSRSFPGVLPFAGKSDDRSKGAGRRRNPTGTGLERRMIGVAAV
jgi:hypothetical protein